MRLPAGTKAMIFAAGLGTRLKPFTNYHPKALAVVNQKPILQRNIEYLSSFGIQDIIVNVHHFADQIIEFLQTNKNFGCHISISHEVEEPLETGGGLKKASWYFRDTPLPFVVMNADILTNMDLQKMYVFHLAKKGIATLAVTNRKSSRNFLYDDNHRLVGWQNISSGAQRISREADHLHAGAFTCIHIINPGMPELIQQEGKFSIIDSYLDIAKKEDVYIFEHSGDLVVDVGKPESIALAEDYFK